METLHQIMFEEPELAWRRPEVGSLAQLAYELLRDSSRAEDIFGKEAVTSGTMEFPLLYQTANLGITQESLDEMINKKFKVLDVGCGIKPHLVNWLRKRKVNAEGIDERIKETKPYFMQSSLKGLKPAKGHIPRKDGMYDRVFLHSVYEVTSYLTTGYTDQPGPEVVASSVMKLLECLRVTKKTGKLVIWPSIDRTDILQYAIRSDGWKISNEIIDTTHHKFLEGPRAYKFGRERTVISR